MMLRSKYFFIFCVAVLLLLETAWAGPKPSGNFIVSEFSDRLDDSTGQFIRPWAALSHVFLNGQASGTHENLASSDGNLDPGSDFTYKVYPGGLTKIFVDPQNDQIFFPGAVSPEATYLAISMLDPDKPGIGFGIKYPTNTPVVVGKTYWACQFNNAVEDFGSGPISVPVTTFMQIDLNANNQGYRTDIDRTIGELEDGPFEYTVDGNPSDGNLTVQVTIPNEGTFTFTGIVSQDGSVFSFPFLGPSEPGIMIGIEKATNFTIDKAKGKYFLVEIDDQLDNCSAPEQGSRPQAHMSQIKLDGQGNGMFKELYTSDIYNEDFPESGEFTYSVASDGQMTINTPEGSIAGFIRADGNLFVIPGLDPCEPGIAIGIKASPSALTAPSMLLLED